MNIDRILSLVMAVTLIIVLCFLYIIFQDLGDLWTEAEKHLELVYDVR
jgi:isoprenylcysteine carboxyl methyltransferase (ICMT) family protein YpbQ